MEKLIVEKEKHELFKNVNVNQIPRKVNKLQKDKYKTGGNEAVRIQIDTNNSLQRSNRRSAEIIEQGNSVLTSLARQSETMKVQIHNILSY